MFTKVHPDVSEIFVNGGLKEHELQLTKSLTNHHHCEAVENDHANLKTSKGGQRLS